jgi:hypothetical protein
MAKRKIDQRQTKVHRTHYRKVKIEQLDPTQNLGWIQMLWKGTVPVIIVAPVVLVTLSKNPMMNHYMKEERRRLWLRYAEYIHCSLWHRYSACHDSDRKISKLGFLVCSNPLSRKYKLVHEYKKCTINEKICPHAYAKAARMFIQKVKSHWNNFFCHRVSFWTDRRSLSIYRCRPK